MARRLGDCQSSEPGVFLPDNLPWTGHVPVRSGRLTKFRRQAGYPQQRTLTFSQARKSGVRVPAGAGSGDTRLLRADASFSLCVLTWQRERELSGVFSHQDTDPIRSEHCPLTSFNLNCSCKSLVYKYSDVGALTYELRDWRGWEGRHNLIHSNTRTQSIPFSSFLDVI